MTNERNVLPLMAFALLALSAISHASGMETGQAMAALPGGVLTPINESAGSNGTARLIVSAFPLQAAVPRMSEFTLQAEDENKSALHHVTFDVRLVQTEDDKVVFATRLHDHEGMAHFSYGFNDGSEHRLEVTMEQEKKDEVTRPAPPLRHEYLIDVEPQQPTPAFQARSQSAFLLVFGIGALLGRWWGKRRPSKADDAPTASEAVERGRENATKAKHA